MRIGDPETDMLFEKAISPAMRACGLTPVRIDKVEHNDDIDDRIMSEIVRADVVVSDLTFARPSAYFEAGYAGGMGKPVIYTARRDHFRARDDDPLGNLRVHFDLQMKNIIAWTDPKSTTFRKKLERRLRLVLAPILRARTADKEAADARAEFSKMSMASRLEAIADAAQGLLESLDYKLIQLGTPAGSPYSYATQLILQRTPPDLLTDGFVGTAAYPGAIEGVWVRVAESLPLTTLRAMNALMEFAPPHDMNPAPGVRPNRVVEHVVLCSLGQIPTARIQKAFTAYDEIAEGHFVRSLRHAAPQSRAREETLLIGHIAPLARVGVSPAGPGLWRALGFDADRPYSTARHYDMDSRHLLNPIPSGTWKFPAHFGRPPKPQILARIKSVPRRVNLHVLDGIDSVGALEISLNEIRERILETRRRKV